MNVQGQVLMIVLGAVIGLLLWEKKDVSFFAFMAAFMVFFQNSVETKIDEVKQDIDEVKQGLGNLRNVIGQILPLAGFEAAHRVSVSITAIPFTVGEDEDHGPDGHGMLTVEADGSIWLVSAAHVIVEIYNRDVTIRPVHGGKGVDMRLRQYRIYLSPNYVLDGSHDFGMVQVDFIRKTRTTLSTVECGFQKLVPSKLAGKSSEFAIEGSLLEVGTSRAHLQAVSCPGTSGAPIFSAQGDLVGVLHGSSKHSRKGDTNASDYSTTVYVDLPFGLHVQKTSETALDALARAEGLDDGKCVTDEHNRTALSSIVDALLFQNTTLLDADREKLQKLLQEKLGATDTDTTGVPSITEASTTATTNTNEEKQSATNTDATGVSPSESTSAATSEPSLSQEKLSATNTDTTGVSPSTEPTAEQLSTAGKTSVGATTSSTAAETAATVAIDKDDMAFVLDKLHEVAFFGTENLPTKSFGKLRVVVWS